MAVADIVRSSFRLCGLEITRIATHRGICLEADLKRLFPGGEALTFFDIGANIGNFSKRLADGFPTADIFAFEPVPDTYKKLKHRQLHRVRPMQLAIGHHTGSVSMELLPQSGWNRILRSSPSSTELPIINVEMTTVDCFCDENGVHKIDFLKTDCEGYDYHVLRGASKLLGTGNIRAVYCEVNFLQDCFHGDFFKIHEFLVKFDFEFYALYDYSSPSAEGARMFTNALWIRRLGQTAR